jgi:hypothetical protein
VHVNVIIPFRGGALAMEHFSFPHHCLPPFKGGLEFGPD